MQGVTVWSLVKELRSHMPCGLVKKLKLKKKKKRKYSENALLGECWKSSSFPGGSVVKDYACQSVQEMLETPVLSLGQEDPLKE